MKNQIYLKKFVLILGLLFNLSQGQQSCSDAKTQQTCLNKADCQWNQNSLQSSCQNLNLQCSLLTQSQCTGVCTLNNALGSCIQIQNLGCSALTASQCNQNSMCVLNGQTCSDRNYNCTQNDRSGCLNQQGICYWQQTAAGTCVNTITCTGKTQQDCSNNQSNCQWVIGGTCGSKNINIISNTSSYLIKFSLQLLISLLILIISI
ncbi:hypothetical protein ABPG72_005259 [Tetrahymena utriculariae]